MQKNIEEILIDHAFCEQKAASTAISLIVTYPEYSDLVTAMTALAKEEMSHFHLNLEFPVLLVLMVSAAMIPILGPNLCW